MDRHGEEMIHRFEGMNPRWKEFLAGAKLRRPDRTFDRELDLDLGGGVKARLLWFGGAHTKGDELTFVLPDKTLISGDVVQNKVVPNIYGDGGTPSSWIAVLDQVEKLGRRTRLPTHSPAGDGSLVAKEKAFIVDLRTRALALKRQGVAVDEAGRRLTEEFKKKYSRLAHQGRDEFREEHLRRVRPAMGRAHPPLDPARLRPCDRERPAIAEPSHTPGCGAMPACAFMRSHSRHRLPRPSVPSLIRAQ